MLICVYITDVLVRLEFEIKLEPMLLSCTAATAHSISNSFILDIDGAEEAQTGIRIYSKIE